MCPDCKLVWLKHHKEIDARKLKAIKKQVIDQWQTTYAIQTADIPVAKKTRDKVILHMLIFYYY